MELILDGILLATAALIVILCAHSGFVKSVLSFGKTIFSLIIAWIFGGMVADWLAGAFIGEWIHGSVYSMFLNMYESGAETFDLSRAVEGIPDTILAILDRLHVDMDAIRSFGTVTDASLAQVGELSKAVSAPIVSFVSSVIGYVAVFLASLLVVTLLIHFSDVLTSLPVIHFCDRTLGFLLGVLLALVVLILLSRAGTALLTAYSSANPDSPVAGVYEKTVILKYLNSLFG